MDDETKQAIADAEQRAKDFATGLSAKYVKADSAFQVYRREHPIAFQNILIFAYGPVMALLGWLVGSWK